MDESFDEPVDNPEAGRYELWRDGELAGVVEYRVDDGVFVIPHVEVVPALRGKGVSGPFLDRVLGVVAERGLRVRPLCGYARGHIAERADLQHLLA